jgi:type I restriction enzyme, R subunit
MIRLNAFRLKEDGDAYDASLKPGDTTPLLPISEFAAKPYTPEEEISLSKIIQSFNQRHGTEFTKEDFLRFEQVNREVLDSEMIEMLRNNPPDVVYSAFSDAFFKGAIKLFQRDAEMKSIVLTDPEARKQATEHFFSRALRAARA